MIADTSITFGPPASAAKMKSQQTTAEMYNVPAKALASPYCHGPHLLLA